MADSQYPDPRYPIQTHLNITAEELLKGQDPKGIVMCFFRLNPHSPTADWPHRARILIREIAVEEIPYRAGHLEWPAIPKLVPITVKVAKPHIPEWESPEVA